MIDRFRLGGPAGPRRGRLRSAELPVLQLVDGALIRLPLLLAIDVDVGVGEDPVQPRLQIRTLREGLPGGEGLDERLLDEVGGVRGVARHPHRGGVQLIHERERLLLELGARIGRLVGLFAHQAPVYGGVLAFEYDGHDGGTPFRPTPPRVGRGGGCQ